MYKYLFLLILLSCNTSIDKKDKEVTAPNLDLQSTDSITKYKLIKKDTLTATAVLLSKAFAENEVAANKKYKEQLIKVSGTIKQINIGISDKAYIVLKGVDRFTEPFCYLSHLEDAEKLKTGDNITLIGECTGLWANLIFKDCKLINTP